MSRTTQEILEQLAAEFSGQLAVTSLASRERVAAMIVQRANELGLNIRDHSWRTTPNGGVELVLNPRLDTMLNTVTVA